MPGDHVVEDRRRHGDIPLWILRRAEVRGPSVVVLHGLAAGKDGQAKELHSLARAGWCAVGMDAPHHGERRDAWLDEMDAADARHSHVLFLRLLPELVAEVRRVVAFLDEQGHGPTALLGISMGAYAALAAAALEPKIRAVVSILGSPDWSARPHAKSDEAAQRARGAPVHHPERFPPLPLLLANAGRDEHVPAGPMRRFHDVLRPLYLDAPGRLQYVEYPDSGHFMREEDWNDLWAKALDFLQQHLRQ